MTSILKNTIGIFLICANMFLFYEGGRRAYADKLFEEKPSQEIKVYLITYRVKKDKVWGPVIKAKVAAPSASDARETIRMNVPGAEIISTTEVVAK